MNPNTRLGTSEDVLAGKSKEIQLITQRLRETIMTIHPDCEEVPHPGWPSAAFGVGEKKMSELFVHIMP